MKRNTALVPLVAAFLRLATIVCAQQLPLPPFNEAVRCPDGLARSNERCIYRSERNGALENRAQTLREVLSERLKDGKGRSGGTGRPGSNGQGLGSSGPAASRASQTLNPPYLAKLLAADRIMREVQGKDPIDTAARQSGAFWLFREVISRMAMNQRRAETPDEQRMRGDYYASHSRLLQTLSNSLAGDKPCLFALQGYASDQGFLDDLLGRLALRVSAMNSGRARVR